MRKLKCTIGGEPGTIGYEDLGEINGVYRAKFVLDGIEIISTAEIGATPERRAYLACKALRHFAVERIEFEE